ncbi:MAG: hypothetical protein JNL25_18715 [Rhodospirillaceae bacterium]|nr:hypothetical protein [Rhodospirillaceae bacterium]
MNPLYQSDLHSALQQCAREKLTAAVAEPVGEKACANLADLDEYATCLMRGAMFNRVRGNVGSPTRLSEAEWRDATAAGNNTQAEILAQVFSQCTAGDRSAIERCQMEVALGSFQLSADEVKNCLGRKSLAGTCIADKFISSYIRDISLTIW